MRQIITARYPLNRVAEALNLENVKKNVKVLVSRHFDKFRNAEVRYTKKFPLCLIQLAR